MLPGPSVAAKVSCAAVPEELALRACNCNAHEYNTRLYFERILLNNCTTLHTYKQLYNGVRSRRARHDC